MAASSASMERGDCDFEAVAPNEPHCVIGAAAIVGAQAVHRRNARVLKSACDFCLQEKAVATDRVVCVAFKDLLERHFAIQLGVERHKHRPQPALSVWPQDAEPLAVAGS